MPPLSLVPSEQVRLQSTSSGHFPPEQVIAEEMVIVAHFTCVGSVGADSDCSVIELSSRVAAAAVVGLCLLTSLPPAVDLWVLTSLQTTSPPRTAPSPSFHWYSSPSASTAHRWIVPSFRREKVHLVDEARPDDAKVVVLSART